MLFELILNLWATPENIIGLIFRVLLLLGLCLIFSAWKEAWWKSLIPFYGTYLLYRHTWGRLVWLFFVQILLDVIRAACARTMTRHLVGGLLETIRLYGQTGKLESDISAGLLLSCLAGLLVIGALVFLLSRVTYLKICDSLGLGNGLLKVGTFLLPEVFLLVDYVCWRRLVKNGLSQKEL